MMKRLVWRGGTSAGHDQRSRGSPPFRVDWNLLAPSRATQLEWGLVSCLCVTRGRLAHVRRMLRCFRAQTYRDKELVLVYENLEPAARELLAEGGDAISLVHVPSAPKQPLGALRNLGIRASRGKYVCGWDDDDWYAPRRLEAQLEHLIHSRADACVLRRWLMFDETRYAFTVSESPSNLAAA